jgi:hypothetical protein
LTTDLPPFAAVASKEPTHNSDRIFIDTIGEWYINGMAGEGRHPSFHAAQCRGGNPCNYSEKNLIPLATDLPSFAAVASGEQTYTLEGIFIDTIGELYTNGN